MDTKTDEFSEQEIKRRRDDAVRRALSTPPQPKKAKRKGEREEKPGRSRAPRR